MSLSAKQCDFACKLALLIQKAQEFGYAVKIAQYLRTVEQEQAEMDAGRSWLTDPNHSKHVLGLAADLALFKDGNYLPDDPGYAKLGEYWASIGGVWGGTWTSPDRDHYEIEP